MTQRNIKYGTRTAYTNVSNMNSLPTGQAKVFKQVDNSATLALDYHVYLKLNLDTSGVSLTSGIVEVYLLESQTTLSSADGTDGIDAATPSTADISASIRNAKLLTILNANSSGATLRWSGRLRDYVGYIPNVHSLAIKNLSGTTFAASSHDAEYVPIFETST